MSIELLVYTGLDWLQARHTYILYIVLDVLRARHTYVHGARWAVHTWG